MSDRRTFAARRICCRGCGTLRLPPIYAQQLGGARQESEMNETQDDPQAEISIGKQGEQNQQDLQEQAEQAPQHEGEQSARPAAQQGGQAASPPNAAASQRQGKSSSLNGSANQATSDRQSGSLSRDSSKGLPHPPAGRRRRQCRSWSLQHARTAERRAQQGRHRKRAITEPRRDAQRRIARPALGSTLARTDIGHKEKAIISITNTMLGS